ncbi:hypothetical protein M8C21_007002 [Ambrosia artemisiifolia]|uniref:Uncharacterized protein n=1 Tax=Ambrosia artemisiifolia TaxID=4212 RepID=A0AAD5GJ71_AMBAR|nr:hypothetical protein M8C21_007002 [Ambrosia artemisiifolia]
MKTRRSWMLQYGSKEMMSQSYNNKVEGSLPITSSSSSSSKDGRASDNGFIRGTRLGAIAGFTCLLVSSQDLSVTTSPSMADFMEELFRGRFAEERFPPELLTAYHWQYTDKWAERCERDKWTKWGDKWDEHFDPNGHGMKQGETWWEGAYGERWNKTWGEGHNGSGWVHRYGKSRCSQHWDTHDDTADELAKSIREFVTRLPQPIKASKKKDPVQDHIREMLDEATPNVQHHGFGGHDHSHGHGKEVGYPSGYGLKDEL